MKLGLRCHSSTMNKIKDVNMKKTQDNKMTYWRRDGVNNKLKQGEEMGADLS